MRSTRRKIKPNSTHSQSDLFAVVSHGSHWLMMEDTVGTPHSSVGPPHMCCSSVNKDHHPAPYYSTGPQFLEHLEQWHADSNWDNLGSHLTWKAKEGKWLISRSQPINCSCLSSSLRVPTSLYTLMAGTKCPGVWLRCWVGMKTLFSAAPQTCWGSSCRGGQEPRPQSLSWAVQRLLFLLLSGSLTWGQCWICTYWKHQTEWLDKLQHHAASPTVWGRHQTHSEEKGCESWLTWMTGWFLSLHSTEPLLITLVDIILGKTGILPSQQKPLHSTTLNVLNFLLIKLGTLKRTLTGCSISRIRETVGFFTQSISYCKRNSDSKSSCNFTIIFGIKKIKQQFNPLSLSQVDRRIWMSQQIQQKAEPIFFCKLSLVSVFFFFSSNREEENIHSKATKYLDGCGMIS